MIFFALSALILSSLIFVMTMYITKLQDEIHALENTIKLYEENIFIILEALSSLDEEFPG